MSKKEQPQRNDIIDPMAEIKKRIGVNILEPLINKGYLLEINHAENCKALNENLKNPAVIYFNHISGDDPFFIAHLFLKHLPNRVGNLIFPVSDEYTIFKNFPAYATAVYLAQSVFGFQMLPIVQSYRLRDDQLSKPNKEELSQKVFELGRRFVNTVNEELPKGATIIVAPEGHRSSSGVLQPAENGLGQIANKLQHQQKDGFISDALFLPVGIRYETHSSKTLNFNPLSKPKIAINVGDPLNISDVVQGTKRMLSYLGLNDNEQFISRQQLTTYLMTRLSYLLPEQMQGVYGYQLLPDTLAGRFELAFNKDRKVGVFDKKSQSFIL